MMDYKELVKKLREKDGCHCECLQAATAIETLLAERDAAVGDIPKNCNTCRYWHDGGCVAPLELFGGCDFGVRQAWQWRGQQKEDKED